MCTGTPSRNKIVAWLWRVECNEMLGNPSPAFALLRVPRAEVSATSRRYMT